MVLFLHLTVDNEGELRIIYVRIDNRTGYHKNISITQMCWLLTL
jgi:hypothetical protein